ncbi:hypothetical protein Tco_1496198 [Tanacetum coccineum]
MPRGDGPNKVLERTGDNAYKLELPGDLKISATFNVEDLSPYFEDGPSKNLRTNSSQPGGVDAGTDIAKNHKKTVKTGQTRTWERIECTRDGSF